MVIDVTLTREEAIRYLREVVDEKGADYVYPLSEHHSLCTYVHEDQPSCIVGHVLYRAGLTVEQLKTLDSPGVPVRETSISTLWKEDLLPIDIDQDAIDALHVAQVSQDSQSTWGEALADAKWPTS